MKNKLFNLKRKFLGYFYYSYYLLLNKQYDAKDTVILMGSGRSGTTWLGEIIAAAGFLMITEPTHIRSPLSKDLGFEKEILVENITADAKQRLKNLFEGKNLSAGMMRNNSMNKIKNDRRLLIKEIRCSRIVDTLLEIQPQSKFVHILRHPCSRSEALARDPRFWNRPAGWNALHPGEKKIIEQYAPTLKNFRIEDKYEMAAIHWALDQVKPIQIAQDAPLFIILYEKLVANPQEEINKLFNFLNISEISPRVEEKIFGNSKEVRPWSIDHGNSSIEVRLKHWTKKMSKEKAKKIIDIVEAFGIRGFNSDGSIDEIYFRPRT